MSTHIIDQDARNMAQAALSQIQSHEGECEIFREHASASLGDIKVSIKGLYDRFWVAAISTIAMLTTACATLIYMVISK